MRAIAAGAKPRVGRIPTKDLHLSSDVPQWKEGANEQGESQPLTAKKWDERGIAPLSIWVRANGALEVISGRHRRALALRLGVADVPCEFYYETDGFSATDAKLLDAELNIRDGNGSAKDFARYVRTTGISAEEARARGWMGGRAQSNGVKIAVYGSDSLYNAFINGQINETAAARLAEAAPGEDGLQRVGMREIQERKKSADYAIGVMQALQATQGNSSRGDMGGFLFDMMDDSALDDARRMAEYATRMQRALARMVKSAEGAVKNPEAFSKVTKSEIRRELKAQETLARLKWAQRRWNNYGLYPELAEEARNWDEKAPVTLNIDTLPALPVNGSGTSTFSVTADAGLKEAIHKACLNKLGDKTINRFCSLPSILAYFGEKPQGIYVKGYVLKKLHNKHYLSEQQIYEVAQKLGDPLFVFRDDGNYIFLLEMTAANRKGNESPVMTAIAMEKKDGHLLLSAYPIDNIEKIAGFIDSGKLLYSRYALEEWQQKGEAWHTMPTRRPLSAALLRALAKTLPQGNIPTSQDIVKRQNEKNATFSITSAEYDISGLGSMLEEKAFATLLNDARKEAARRRRVFTRKETPATLAAQGMGRISALMQALYKRLPSKYRPKTAAPPETVFPIPAGDGPNICCVRFSGMPKFTLPMDGKIW